MLRKLQVIVRVIGVALIVFAAVHFVIDAVHSIQTEDHATSDGFHIDHIIEIRHITLAAGFAGAALVGLSFIHVRKGT